LVSASKETHISAALNAKKQELNLNGEIKWTKISENYVEKYCDMIRLFFDYVRSGDIRVRIMFRKTKNQYAPDERPIKAERYFKLYYQFIKHAFGFATDVKVTGNYYVHILMDELPDRTEKANDFKRYLCEMPTYRDFEHSGMHIRERDIAEVHSHDHVLLQCVDIVLGAMQFRLNNLHKAIPDGEHRRGKKTIAKEKVSRCISEEIYSIHPRFNIGISTGDRGMQYPHWESPYEHWEFIPNKNGYPVSPT